jgi:hypothetical protein
VRSRFIVKIRLSSRWTAAMMGIVLFLTSGAALAQSRVSLNGKVTSLKGRSWWWKLPVGPRQ